MAATRTTKVISTIAGAVPVLAIAWFASPIFLPRWRWVNVDWEAEARRAQVPEAELRKEYQAVLRFAPRGDHDPRPWQLMEMKPAWKEGEEERVLVRCTLLGDRWGEPPSTVQTVSGHLRDSFFTATVWRFPPGTFGQNAVLPVVLYSGYSFTKCDTSLAINWDNLARTEWAQEDPDIDDGFRP